MAVQTGQFLAQGDDAGGDGAVVVRAVMRAACHACLQHPLAQVAPRRVGEEGLGQRGRQGDGIGAFAQAALGRGIAGGSAHRIGQPGQVGFAVQRQQPACFLGQQVL